MKRAAAIFLFIVVSVGTARYIYEQSFAEPINFHSHKPERRHDLAVIGDSWANYVKISGVPTHAFPGGTSKLIYQNLQTVISDAPKTVVVIAGINDSARHFGTDYYVHHMTLIVEALRLHGIDPVILEIPDYAIENAWPRNPMPYIRRVLVEGDAIKDYRVALRKYLEGRATFIQFKGGPDLYDSSGIHPNEAGGRLLSTVIAR